MNCLLVTSYFPPVIGGSATVYGTLFKYSNKKLSVLTASMDRDTQRHINRLQNEDIHTVDYVHPPSVNSSSLLHTAWTIIAFDVPANIRLLLKALHIIRYKKIDVVCIGELQAAGWLGTALRFLTNKKVIYYVHGEELTTKTNSRFLGKNARRYLATAHGVVCVSSFTREVLINEYGLSPNKIKLITNGIDLDKFIAANDHISERGRRDDDQSILIFSAGRLIDRKGFDYAIEAMATVVKSHPNTRLVIAGDGPNLKRYQQRVAELGLSSHVSLEGRVPHERLKQLYSECDLFLMPNRELANGDTEGFGLVFLEANAFHKPVIGGRAGGAVDAIIHEQTGLLVDSESISAIADAIIKLVKDKKLRVKLGDNGYRWALQNDAKLKADEFFNYCENLIKS